MGFRRRLRDRLPGGRCENRILAKDCLLEVAQLDSRIDAELVESLPAVSIDLERLRLTA